MFENLSERLQQTVKNLRGQGKLTEANIKDALRDVRVSLLEADVALPVVKKVIAKIKENSLGQEVNKKLSPGQEFIKIVHSELTEIMGKENSALSLNAQPPAIILMAGLQGAGKTTTVAKLAKRIKEKEKKRVAVVSVDIYRPAAIDQLKRVSSQVGAEFIESKPDENPEDIVKRAIEHAKQKIFDVLIIDTAGRNHTDGEMMSEIKKVHAVSKPVETLFVVDAMTGQDAANTAKSFHDALPLTGIILTKVDGDARGGAALSVREITGKPIKFLGMGEKSDALEPFYPERITSRILGMGDVLTLVEEIQESVDQEKAEKLAKKMQSGDRFNLEDFRDQLKQMQSMDISKLMDKIPGVGSLPKEIKDTHLNNQNFKKMSYIIDSMTINERRNPTIIKSSRKQRIARGSGRSVQEINQLLKQFEEMQKQMGRFKKGKLGRMLGMSKMMKGGGLPGGPQGSGIRKTKSKRKKRR